MARNRTQNAGAGLANAVASAGVAASTILAIDSAVEYSVLALGISIVLGIASWLSFFVTHLK